jgi:hypothetical protein
MWTKQVPLAGTKLIMIVLMGLCYLGL